MKIVTVFGGSGFIGRYAARKLAKRGWRVRVAVRRPNEALFLKPYGDVGQIEPVQANIRDDASVRAAIAGADAVINFVGVLFESGAQRFEAVQAEGAGRVARIAAECGVSRFVHISAIGADAESTIPYQRSKGEGEAAVLAAQPGAAILRPSLVFGPEDGFFNLFAGLARFTPVLPVFGAGSKFQPVYADDVAEAAVRALDAPGGVYEIGGPDVLTMRQMIEMLLGEARRKRFLFNMPAPLARIKAWFLQLPNRLLGLRPLLTVDQVKMLQQDNVVAPDARTIGDLGIEPQSLSAVLPGYIVRHRPYGQYAVLRESR